MELNVPNRSSIMKECVPIGLGEAYILLSLSVLWHTSSMPKRSSSDINEMAFAVVEQAARTPSRKNPAAVSLGRLGGLKGGKARANKLSAAKRRQIAKRAANARWQSEVKKRHE